MYNITLPTTLTEFLAQLNLMANNSVTQFSVLDYIKEVAYHMGLSVHYETKQPNEELPAIIYRVIVSCNRNKNGTSNMRRAQLFYECNGLVLDGLTWTPLVIPAGPVENVINVSTNYINSLLTNGKLEIFPVDDGTTITLYNWNHLGENRWGISTVNGYDVSGLRWTGNLTYSETFYDVASRIHPEFVEQTGMTINKKTKLLCFTNLDKNYCYILAFRHHSHHPLTSDPERIWQIGIHQVSESKEVSPPVLPGLACQRKVADSKNMTVQMLQSDCASSLQNAIDGKGLNYGYILSSPRYATKCVKYIIESPLLKQVKN